MAFIIAVASAISAMVVILEIRLMPSINTNIPPSNVPTLPMSPHSTPAIIFATMARRSIVTPICAISVLTPSKLTDPPFLSSLTVVLLNLSMTNIIIRRPPIRAPIIPTAFQSVLTPSGPSILIVNANRTTAPTIISNACANFLIAPALRSQATPLRTLPKLSTTSATFFKILLICPADLLSTLPIPPKKRLTLNTDAVRPVVTTPANTEPTSHCLITCINLSLYPENLDSIPGKPSSRPSLNPSQTDFTTVLMSLLTAAMIAAKALLRLLIPPFSRSEAPDAIPSAMELIIAAPRYRNCSAILTITAISLPGSIFLTIPVIS